MAVTHSFAIGREQCFQQVERLTKSHSLHSSESLCKLLRYLAEHSLDHPGIALKEYQIAAQDLGRDLVFLERDPRVIEGVLSQIAKQLAQRFRAVQAMAFGKPLYLLEALLSSNRK